MVENLDNDLVRDVQTGNAAKFTILVKKYEKSLLRLVQRYIRDQELARDIVQESFLKAYLNIGRFEGRCSFKNWLYKITLNTARNKIRGFKDTDNIDDVVIAEACIIEQDLMHDEIIDRLHLYVERLPLKQKQTLELRVFQDLSFKEVAEIMACPYDTAKANYRHAMLKLKSFFEDSQGSWEHSA